MTPEQRQSAIDNTRERLEVIVALIQYRLNYPMDLQQRADDIVTAVLALTKDRPRQAWPTSFPHPQMLDDDTIERLR